MNFSEAAIAIKPIIEWFDQVGVPYYVGGSVASSAYGKARSTVDVDIVADLNPDDVPVMVRDFSASYYLAEESIRHAVRTRGSFNLIHLQTMLKVDVFVAGATLHDRQALARRRRRLLLDAGEEFYFASPEDLILAKLAWFRDGGQESRKQWDDVLGIVEVQVDSLDMEYLRSEAQVMHLADLLERARVEAGE
ncbi:MAG: hypothetical protein ABFD92_15725 [Planctomycetaceae bacterium]|nr:hypothetical protein [Planctomycetaceae bacterium]